MTRLGLFGGTFDPIHNAHLRLALELKQLCQIDDMRLVPAHIPPHRSTPHCSPQQRLALLRRAVENCPQLGIDERELHRHTPSYTVDTLQELAAEVGPEVSLCLCIGGDSLVNLHTWHRWQEVFELANVIVAVRPGYELPSQGPVAQCLAQRRIDVAQLPQHGRGKIVIADSSLLDISATYIRQELAARRSAQFLVPDAVWAAMAQDGLYMPTKNTKK